jgi:hypothetical protein
LVGKYHNLLLTYKQTKKKSTFVPWKQKGKEGERRRRIRTIRGKEQGRIGQPGDTFSYIHQQIESDSSIKQNLLPKFPGPTRKQ